MPIQSGDFTISLAFAGLSGTIESVIGRPTKLSILFSNKSLTDSLYNLGLTVNLPDGISFVNSSIPPTSNTINGSFSNIITFSNIKDLYSNELNYKVDLEIQIDEYLRSNPSTPVNFMSVFSNLSFSASADTKPRGDIDIGNQHIFVSSTASATAYRYSVVFIGPTSFLKGAGSNSSSADQIFNATIKIENNTREDSTVNLNLDLANGIRYLGNWTATGLNALEFLNPIITTPSLSQNFTSLNVSNINLSAGSINEISFDATIWDKFTLNGIENSGAEIQHGYILESQVSLEYQGEYQYSYLSMEALILMFLETLVSTITDWNVVNQFQISYTVSPYLGINNFYLTQLIPDGMTFIESTPTVDSLVNNGDGTSNITWSLGTLSTNTSGIINLSLLTNSTYFDGSNVASTDTFDTTLTGVFTNPNSGLTSTDSITKTLEVNSPTITKSLVSYYDSNLLEKTINVATVGDYVKFKVIYDSLNINAIQKNVYLFDYPPLNMIMSSVPNYTTTGDFPSNATIELISDNGLMISLGDIAGGTYFEIDFTIEVTLEQSSTVFNNLAKISLDNILGVSTSIRDLAQINFGTPNLAYSNLLTAPNCIKLNDSLNYKLTIKNEPTTTHTNITTAYNVDSQTTIPNKFTVNNIIITSNGLVTYEQPTNTNNLIDFVINSLAPNSSITLEFILSVTTLPILGESFNIENSLALGTSQPNNDSYNYSGSTILQTSTIKACTPTIIKTFSNSIIDAGKALTTNILITIPRGLLGYNLELTDIQLTSDTNNLNNLILNNIPVTNFSIVNQILKIPLIETLNSSSAEISYELTYSDIIYNITPTNNEQTFITTANLNWTNTIASETIYSVNNSATVKVLSPELKIDKYQRNHSKNTPFSKDSITGEINDIILYKIRLENIGKSPAYKISIIDVLDPNLTFISLVVGNGSFAPLTNTLTIFSDTLLEGYYTEFLIETQINSEPQTNLALNSATVDYYLSETQPDIYATASSDSIKIFENLFLLEKEQRNVTLETIFSKDGLSVIKDQVFQYKVTLTNFNKNSLTNIIITDTFPLGIEFLGFEPFSAGTLSVTNNIITANINPLNINESISFIYTLKLTTDILQKTSSYSTISFSTPSDIESFLLKSNIIYTSLFALGRGFNVY